MVTSVGPLADRDSAICPMAQDASLMACSGPHLVHDVARALPILVAQPPHPSLLGLPAASSRITMSMRAGTDLDPITLSLPCANDSTFIAFVLYLSRHAHGHDAHTLSSHVCTYAHASVHTVKHVSVLTVPLPV